jgi:hypothetical protein
MLFTGRDIRGRDRNYGDLKESWQTAFLVKGRFFPDDDFFINLSVMILRGESRLKGRAGLSRRKE